MVFSTRWLPRPDHLAEFPLYMQYLNQKRASQLRLPGGRQELAQLFLNQLGYCQWSVDYNQQNLLNPGEGLRGQEIRVWAELAPKVLLLRLAVFVFGF